MDTFTFDFPHCRCRHLCTTDRGEILQSSFLSSPTLPLCQALSPGATSSRALGRKNSSSDHSDQASFPKKALRALPPTHRLPDIVFGLSTTTSPSAIALVHHHLSFVHSSSALLHLHPIPGNPRPSLHTSSAAHISRTSSVQLSRYLAGPDCHISLYSTVCFLRQPFSHLTDIQKRIAVYLLAIQYLLSTCGPQQLSEEVRSNNPFDCFLAHRLPPIGMPPYLIYGAEQSP